MIGTSAGSMLVTLLATGATPECLLAAQRDPGFAARHGWKHGRPGRRARPPKPSPQPSSLRLAWRGLVTRKPLLALAGISPRGTAGSRGIDALIRLRVPNEGWVEHPKTWVVACDDRTGERVAFGRADAPRISSRAAVRASCAIPGWFAPIELDGRRYVDGGIASPTSLDFLVDQQLDEVVVISPMTSNRTMPAQGLAQRAERLMRRHMSRILDREIEVLEAKGTTVLRIEPNGPELRAMGANFMDPRHRAHTVRVAAP